MTEYYFEDGEIRNSKSKHLVGWLSEELSLISECIEAIKKTLETHGHSLRVESLKSGGDVIVATPSVHGSSPFIYIVDGYDSSNHRYGCLYKTIEYPSECADAVLAVLKGDVA